MSDKKSFVLRIDEKTYDRLRKWANDEFRSVNGQIEYLLKEALQKNGRFKPEADKNKNEKEK